MSRFPQGADCELTWLSFFHFARSRVAWLIESHVWIPDHDGMFSLHLCLGLPLLLFPCTMPSKHNLDKPEVERLTWPKSLRVLLLILQKRGGSDVFSRRVEILVLSINLFPIMKRMTWFWKTSMESNRSLVHEIQSKPCKTTEMSPTHTLILCGKKYLTRNWP